MSDDFREGAKAVQELSKLGQKSIDLTDKVGQFFSKVLGEPIQDAAAAYIGEPLKRIRALRSIENQCKFVDQYEEIVRRRGIDGKTIPVPPKFAIPMLRNASLEDDDEVRSRWAALLVSASDPATATDVRMAFVSILEELSPLDVKVLDLLYHVYAEATADVPRAPSLIPIQAESIRLNCAVSPQRFDVALDNLYRVQCAAAFIDNSESIALSVNGQPGIGTLSMHHMYDFICITHLGLALVEHCSPERTPTERSFPRDTTRRPGIQHLIGASHKPGEL